MIPFIRSLKELEVMTQSRYIFDNSTNSNDYKGLHEDSDQRKRYIRIKDKKEINLPTLPKITRRKFIKSKEAIYKFLDGFNYNNQIQSTYDLTLLDIQNNSNKHDAA
tara:strand:- start:225 stop:545 length:321 start_codon:yes stop_codon:yes gene_type:complete